MLSLFVVRSKRRWLGFLALGSVATLVMASALWAWSVVSQARSLETSWTRVRSAALLEPDPAAWEKELKALRDEAARVQQRLRFLESLGWLPGVGREAAAVAAMTSASVAALDAAQPMLRDMALLRSSPQEILKDPMRGQQAQEAFSLALQQLVLLESPPPRLPPLRERFVALQENIRQLQLLAQAGREAASLLVALQAVAQGAARGEWASEGLQKGLRTALDHLAQAQAPLAELRAAFPQLAPDLEPLTAQMEALEMVVTGSDRGLHALLPAFQVLEERPLLLHNGPVVRRFLAILGDGRDELVAAASQVEAGLGLLPQTSSDALESLQQLPEALRLLADFSQIAPALLGLEGPRRYLVLGQTADELRATGGFVSSVWVITFQDGELMELRYLDTGEVDDLDHLNLYPEPPRGLNLHMQACCWLLRDVSWEPDFPFTARLAQEVYRLGQQKRVDGVVALNQWTLQRLVDFLGGLPSPEGGRIAPQEFMAFLQEKTDDQGRGYARYLLPGILTELERQVEPTSLVTLSRLMQGLFQEKLLLLYLDDPSDQALLRRLGWDGLVSQAPGDYLMVVDSNVGWSKVDRNILRSVSYRVALRPGEESVAYLLLEYQNASGPGASGCELQWVARGHAYTQQMQACYWDYLRVYLPEGSVLAQADPFPLPEGAIYVQQDVGVPGSDTLQMTTAFGKTVLEGLLVVPPGERTRRSFLYELPPGVLLPQEDGWAYQLVLQSQPGVLERQVEVVVTLPQGYRMRRVAPEPLSQGPDRVVWNLSLAQDVRLEVVFGP